MHFQSTLLVLATAFLAGSTALTVFVLPSPIYPTPYISYLISELTDTMVIEKSPRGAPRASRMQRPGMARQERDRRVSDLPDPLHRSVPGTLPRA